MGRYGDELKYLLGKKDYYGRFKEIPVLPYYYSDLLPVVGPSGQKSRRRGGGGGGGSGEEGGTGDNQ